MITVMQGCRLYAGYDHFGDGACEPACERQKNLAKKPRKTLRNVWRHADVRELEARSGRSLALSRTGSKRLANPATVSNMLTQIVSDGRIRLQKAKRLI